MLILNNGTEITRDQIASAFAAGYARIIHGRAENASTTGLLIDGVDRDTRGQCYSVWEEIWTEIPKTLAACIQAAYCK